MPLLSRRALLRTAAAAAVTSAAVVTALETGALPGRAGIHRTLGLTGPDGTVPGALSPALWRHFGDAAPGAFDGAGDFGDNQVLGRRDDFKDVAVRIDCGRDDPFAEAAGDLRVELRAAGGQQAGAHTAGYWRRMLPDHLRFLGGELAE